MKRHKDSVTGKLHLLGRMRNWRKQSLPGLGYFRERPKLRFADADDIELIEQLVQEHVSFDWDKFEALRKIKNEESNTNDKASKKLDGNNEKRLYSLVNRTQKSNSVEVKDETSRSQSDDEDSLIVTDDLLLESKADKTGDSDTESLVAIETPRKSLEEEVMGKISSEGEEKLKFIMDFASSSAKSRETKTKRNRLSEPSNSDQFAKYKGFKNLEHQIKHYERLRGFEELKNMLQTDLMAKQAGFKLSQHYTPGDQEVPKGKKQENIDSEKQVINLSLESFGSFEEFSDVGNADSDVGLESDEESLEDEDIKRLYEFGELGEVDSGNKTTKTDFDPLDLNNLIKTWDKVEGFNYPKDEIEKVEEEIKRRLTLRMQEKKEKLKDALVNGKKFKEKESTRWQKKKQQEKEREDEQAVLFKRRVHDSLTLDHLKQFNMGQVNINLEFDE